MKQAIIEIEEYANEHNVPIIDKCSIAFIMKYIRSKGIKNVLEIGSSIGYSAILMATALKDGGRITTIEKASERYLECLNNVKKCNMEEKINVVFQDALEVNLSDTEYDLIFIDAAKGQYIKYFDKFKFFLAKGGTIITDNLKFHGLVGAKSKINSENLKNLVHKIEEYIEYLKGQDDFETKFYDVGDGLGVSIKKD